MASYFADVAILDFNIQRNQKQAIQIISMKQQLDLSTILQPSDSSSSKKDKPERKRHIRKDTTTLELQRQKKIVRQAKRQLSKEEKLRLQKEKNRFHAQKSRDEHKEYVNGLERQIKILREELERSKRFCCECKKPIDLEEQGPSVGQAPVNLEHFNRDEITWKQDPFQFNESITDKEGSASFLRIFQEKEDNHFLKMIIFILAIVVAIVFVNGPRGDYHSVKGIMLPSIQTFTISESLGPGLQSNETLSHASDQRGLEEHQKLHSSQKQVHVDPILKSQKSESTKDLDASFNFIPEGSLKQKTEMKQGQAKEKTPILIIKEGQ